MALQLFGTKVSCKFETEAASATQGADYVHTEARAESSADGLVVKGPITGRAGYQDESVGYEQR